MKEVRKKLLTDDEIIAASVEVLQDEMFKDIIEDVPALPLLLCMHISKTLAILFKDDEPQTKKFKKHCSVIQDDFKHEIFSGGLCGDSYYYVRSKLPQDKPVCKHVHDTLDSAYNELIFNLIKC